MVNQITQLAEGMPYKLDPIRLVRMVNQIHWLGAGESLSGKICFTHVTSTWGSYGSLSLG